jgi:hypothetical protein
VEAKERVVIGAADCVCTQSIVRTACARC